MYRHRFRRDSTGFFIYSNMSLPKMFHIFANTPDETKCYYSRLNSAKNTATSYVCTTSYVAVNYGEHFESKETMLPLMERCPHKVLWKFIGAFKMIKTHVHDGSNLVILIKIKTCSLNVHNSRHNMVLKYVPYSTACLIA